MDRGREVNLAFRPAAQLWMEGFQAPAVNSLHLESQPHHRCSWHLWASCPFLLVFFFFCSLPWSLLWWHQQLHNCSVYKPESHPYFPFLRDPHLITRCCQCYPVKRSHVQTHLSPHCLRLCSRHLISCQDFYVTHPTDLPGSRCDPSKTIFELQSE